MAKYAELEAKVNIAARGEIMGTPRKEKCSTTPDKEVKGGENHRLPDTGKKGVTV